MIGEGKKKSFNKTSFIEYSKCYFSFNGSDLKNGVRDITQCIPIPHDERGLKKV